MEVLKIVDIDTAKFDAFRKLFLPCNTHNEILNLCETHGGKIITDALTSNKISYDFRNNVFLPDCRITWNSRNFRGIKITLYIPERSSTKSQYETVLKKAPH